MEKEIKFSLVIYPDTKSTPVYWRVVPKEKEIVFYKERAYEVEKVWHNMDSGEIKVFLNETRNP